MWWRKRDSKVNLSIYDTWSVLTEVQKYITSEKKTLLTSSFIKPASLGNEKLNKPPSKQRKYLIIPQFNFNSFNFITSLPQICIFCSKKDVFRLNDIHESSLRLKHQGYVSNFITLLINAYEKSIPQTCLEFETFLFI